MLLARASNLCMPNVGLTRGLFAQLTCSLIQYLIAHYNFVVVRTPTYYKSMNTKLVE